MSGLCGKCEYYRDKRCMILGTSPSEIGRTVYKHLDMVITYETKIIKCSKFDKKEVIRRKHDKDLVLKAVTRLSPTITGEILEEYNKLHNTKITTRHLLNLLKELETEGLVQGRVQSWGRYGRTTRWRRVYKKARGKEE